MKIGKHRGADVLARALDSAGVARIFTLSGNHIMPVFDAALDAGIALVHVRHEAAAVHMADAWARLTGEVGVAMVTGGPGHANAVSALYTAAMAEAPVVLLSGHAPKAQLGRGAFQEMRQAEIAAPLCKAAWTCADADSIARDFARAVSIARSGRPGPVHLSLPSDALEAACSSDRLPGIADFAPQPMPLDPALAAAMLERLRGGARPIILCGPACMTRSGRARMGALEAASGIPVIGMESPRGIADPSLGAFSEVLALADRVLLVGKRLDFTLKFGAAPAFDGRCEFLQVDADPAEIDCARRAVGHRLVATAAAEAHGALETLAGVARPVRGTWLEEVRAAVAYRPRDWEGATASTPGRLHPVQACRPLQAILDRDDDAVLVCDGGEFGQWAQACLHAPNRVINGVAGSIGAALPYALAARIARPAAPVLAFLGDGTFGFHPAEIDTAVRYALGFVLVVGHDARWNAEYQIQVRDYGARRAIGCELLPTRYDRVCEAFGGYGETVTEAAALLPAAQRALGSGLPACLNVAIEGLAAPTFRR